MVTDIMIYISGYLGQSLHALNTDIYKNLIIYEQSVEWFDKYINYMIHLKLNHMVLENKYSNKYNWKKEYLRIIKYKHWHLFADSDKKRY